jgi:hypothetical protein
MNHDVGGEHGGPIDFSPHPMQHWEYSIHALLVVLATQSPPLITTDELRRGVESLEAASYRDWGYYDRWSSSMASILLERGVIGQRELDDELFGPEEAGEVASLHVGDLVRVKSEDTRSRWRKPHLRCPGYIFGVSGRIQKYVGKFADPYFLAFRGSGPPQHLYTVSFRRRDLWPESAAENDLITLEVYHNWLEKISVVDSCEEPSHGHHEHDAGADARADGGLLTLDEDPGHTHSVPRSHEPSSRPLDHDHAHGGGGDHSHGHAHEERAAVEASAVEREGPPTPGQQIGEALLRLLARKGVIDMAAINKTIESLDSAGKVLRGAELVARAWLDHEFKARLLADGRAA